MPRASQLCIEYGCLRMTRGTRCYEHSLRGGRPPNAVRRQPSIVLGFGYGVQQTKRLCFRLFCLMCARDEYRDDIPGGGHAVLECGHCGGRVFVDVEDLADLQARSYA